MRVLADCPNCDYTREVDESLTGYKGQCPDCGAIFIIGGKDAQGQERERRRERRVACTNLVLYIGVAGEYLIHDFNSKGVRFDNTYSDWDFEKDKVMTCDVLVNKSPLLISVKVRVVRRTKNTVACVFQNLLADQVIALRNMMRMQESGKMTATGVKVQDEGQGKNVVQAKETASGKDPDIQVRIRNK